MSTNGIHNADTSPARWLYTDESTGRKPTAGAGRAARHGRDAGRP